MNPFEQKVLGTGVSKSLQSQIDEVVHEIGMIQDLQKTEISDLNRVEADIGVLKTWRDTMPSPLDISKRRVAKDDPIHGLFDNLRK